MLLLKGSKGPLNISSGVDLSINLVSSIPYPLFDHENLLSDLHNNSKVIKYTCI